MKKVLLVLFFIVGICNAQAQFSNDWVKFSPGKSHSDQQYFKIRIGKNGVYRVSVKTLENVGIKMKTIAHPAEPISPLSFQLFAKGQQQPMRMQGFNGGAIDDNGYFEFYAEKNDGWYDRQLYYPDNNLHQNPYFSLYSDTSTYFLTWTTDGTPGLRYDEETESQFDSYALVPQIWKDEVVSFSDARDEYSHGLLEPYANLDEPEFVMSEGFVGYPFTINFNFRPTIPPVFNTTNIIPQSTATFTTHLVGMSNDGSFAGKDHHIVISAGGKQIADTSYDNYEMLPLSIQTSTNNFINGITSVSYLSSWPTGVPRPQADRSSVSFMKLRFPHAMTFQNETNPSHTLYVGDNPSGQPWNLAFSNYDNNASPTILYDVSNNRWIKVTVDIGGRYNALVRKGSKEHKLYLTNESAVYQVAASQIKPVSTGTNYAQFTNYNVNGANSNYLIVTHKSLMGNELDEYVNYRTKSGFKVLVLDINELYDQFCYGIDFNPLAVRNFAKFSLAKWTTKPAYLFLVGKSITPHLVRRTPYAYEQMSLVPTYGSPPADNLLTAHIAENGDALYNSISTGRLSVLNKEGIRNYLDKVIAYEANPPGLWAKRSILLAGGSDDSQKALFSAWLKIYGDTLGRPYFGGTSTLFVKDQAFPQTITQSDSITELINNGVGLIAFFGHASANFFDVNLDDPANYNPLPGHYPVFVANGCSAGNVHTPDGSISENYVLIKDKGAIGFMGTTSLVLAGQLHNYSQSFYNNVARKMYGKPFSDAIRSTLYDLRNDMKTDVYYREVCQELTFEGDPAATINYWDAPDYEVKGEDVRFTPPAVSTDLDSFIVTINLKNIARATNDTFYLDMTRTFPDGTDTTYRIKVSEMYFQKYYSFKLPVNGRHGAGQNHFHIFADADPIVKVGEYSARNPNGEFNNTADVDLIISTKELIPTYPPNFAIVPENKVQLKAVTGDLFAPVQSYDVQVDTAGTFANPILTQMITQSGGIVSIELNNLVDSATYYWRVSVAGKNQWRQSSFTYIPGKSGWAQDHTYQLAQNKHQNIYFDTLGSRKYNFVKEIKNIRAFTHYGNYSPDKIRYEMNSSVQRVGKCISDGLIFAVIDPNTGKPWENTGNGYKNVPCNGIKGFDYYDSNQSWSDNIMTLLSAVPNGHYVLAYSVNTHFDKYDTLAFIKEFDKMGSKVTKTLLDTVPFIFFGRKGLPSRAREVVGKNSKEEIQLQEDTITVNYNQGVVSTERIGPSKRWDSFHWRNHQVEVNPSDSMYVDIYGIMKSGAQKLLIPHYSKTGNKVDLSGIDADTYPYLRIDCYMQDSPNRTPDQLDWWRIYYDAVPEGSINAAKAFSFYADTLNEGEVLKFKICFENISNVPMDSVLTHVNIVSRNNTKTDLVKRHLKPLAVAGTPDNDTITLMLNVDTRGLVGNNTLQVLFNPELDQPEQTYFNNVALFPFFVKSDRINPLLDVTFDGQHILNGDIVSPKPEIVIRLNDENKYLAIKDTNSFRMWLLPPGVEEADKSRVYFSQTSYPVNFNPAVLPRNSAEITMHPNLTQDGIYTLMVEAIDASKNHSGKRYSVTFEVVNKSSITEVLNYPNPFSTRTQFVFTLTGSEIPSEFKVQIMTVSGKVVREITKEELGPIRIGRNITEYAWDGKDEFGDLLANGVYVYRVLTKINGAKIDERQTSADHFFKKGYGKMYILR